LGAQFVGYSKKITGTRFEYEHAMPATSAYLYLLDAALSDADFNTAYDLVIDNYKLIALDKAMDKKLTAVGLQRRMPIGWDLIENNWWDRYFNETVGRVDGGIDVIESYMRDGITQGIIKKAGAWYTFGEDKAQGMNGLKELIVSKPELLEILKNDVT
jgi:hypothetical protein